jgi:hypothetical protein
VIGALETHKNRSFIFLFQFQFKLNSLVSSRKSCLFKCTNLTCRSRRESSRPDASRAVRSAATALMRIQIWAPRSRAEVEQQNNFSLSLSLSHFLFQRFDTARFRSILFDSVAKIVDSKSVLKQVPSIVILFGYKTRQ